MISLKYIDDKPKNVDIITPEHIKYKNKSKTLDSLRNYILFSKK